MKKPGDARKGFASMTPERRAEVAGMGGRTAHANGTAHEFTSESAREAAKKRHAPKKAKK